jgi:predicted membrane protein
MEPKTAFRITPQLILGLTIISVGVLFLLDNLGYIYAESYWHYWPVVLIIFGLARLFETGEAPSKFMGVVFTVIGSLLLLQSLHLTRFNFWNFWPVILIMGGIVMVWKVMTGASTRPHDEAVIRGAAMLGGFKRTCSSQEFRGGELTAIMGGCEIDLREASLQGKAVINCFAFWGGIEIKVPEDWSVSIQAIPLLGGFDDKTRPPRGGSEKVLIVQGFAVMGGIEVKN